MPPTATAVPPTATAVPPTATATPPTATAVPPTATPSGPRSLVVDASGSGDYRTIASAILGARPQDTIILRPGTYKESLIVRSDVQIVGEGGRSKVIVQGEPGAHVFDFLGGSATLTGITIRIVGTGPPNTVWGAISVRGGTAVIEDCDLTSSGGWAVGIIGASANPVIRNCTMRDSRDAGLLVSSNGQGTIEQCVISGNGLAGVQISKGGNATVRDCEIRDGKSAGVVVYDEGQGTIEKCVISGNGASGVAILEGGSPTVRYCQVNGNKQAGVYVYEKGEGTFTGNILTGNANGAWDIHPTAGRVTRTGNRPNA